MRDLIRKAWKQDRGAALAIIATSLFLLIGVAAISADLAWYYLNASRVQRTADAAALAGVVYLPVAPGTANSTAIDIANRNGYDDTLADVSVTPTAISENQLQVRVSDDVDTFFAKVLGWDTMTISRSAVAEYIPPLKLGSPENQFGNDCDPTQSGCPPQDANFWANIHGKWTQRSMGDAYSSWCTNAPDNPGCNQNPFARSSGYLYGIESSGSFTIQGNDLAFYNTSGGNPTGDYIRTGDRGCEDWGPSTAADCGPTMVVTLYAPDPTPLDVSNNAVLCTATIPPVPQVPVADPYPWQTPDGQGCWTQSGTGIFILQVRHEDPGNTTNRAGLNRYGIRASGAGANLFA
ncbi:MAG: pilus assembly protein TadG-related protein, partial [Acidimicrobiia bacterium]